MELLVKVVVIGLFLAGFWYAFRRRYAFVVRIEEGTPRVAAGKVTAAFLREVAEACADLDVRRGWVGGVYRGRRRVVLTFSRGMPEQYRQRLRNVWLVEG